MRRSVQERSMIAPVSSGSLHHGQAPIPCIECKGRASIIGALRVSTWAPASMTNHAGT